MKTLFSFYYWVVTLDFFYELTQNPCLIFFGFSQSNALFVHRERITMSSVCRSRIRKSMVGMIWWCDDISLDFPLTIRISSQFVCMLHIHIYMYSYCSTYMHTYHTIRTPNLVFCWFYFVFHFFLNSKYICMYAESRTGNEVKS